MCVLSVSLTLKASPFQNEREADEAKHRPIVPPNMTTPIEVQALAFFTTWVANATLCVHGKVCRV